MRLTRVAAGTVVLAATVLASGCASMKSEPQELDAAYIAYVERAAKLYATQVIWVNPPTRPVAAARAAPPEQPVK